MRFHSMLYLLSPDNQNRALQLEMITQEIRRHAALVTHCAGNQVSKIATQGWICRLPGARENITVCGVVPVPASTHRVS